MHLTNGQRARLRRVGGASAGLWGATALSFAGTVIAARAFGPSEYGLFVLALATATLISTLLDLTLEQGVVHHGFRLLHERDIRGLRSLIKTALIVDAAIGVVITAAILVLADPIATAVGGGLTGDLMRVAALTVLACTIDSTTGATLLLAERPQVRAYAMACAGAFRLVAILIAISIGDIEALIAAFAIGTAMGSALQALIAYRVGWRKWPSDGPSRPSLTTARKLMPFAIHSSLTTTILGATDSIILIFLGRVSGSAAAALFRIATLPQMAAALASAPLRLVMFPDQQKLAAQGRLEELRRDLFRWTAIATAVATPAAVAGVFLLPWLIPAVYGHQYADAVPAAQILIVFAWTAFAVPWTKNFAAIIGRPRLQSLLAGLMLVIALPVTIAFGDSGATAAAAGVSAGAVAMTLGYVWAARRYFEEQRRSGVRDDGADDVREPLAEVAAG